MGRLGVIIANTGTPAAPTPEAVKAYLREFLQDSRICPMNPLVWKVVLNAFILPKRSVASAKKYASIWTDAGSPLGVTMRSLAAKLDGEASVRAAMSYGHPDMGEALQALRSEGCDRLLAIPLYPQTAFSTSRVVHDRLVKTLGDLAWKPSLRLCGSYAEHPRYISAIADSIREAGFSEGDRLLFAFHSIPMKDVDAGDSYPEEVAATVEAVVKECGVPDDAYGVGFQCRFDRGRIWLTPTTAHVVEELTGDGFDRDRARLFVIAPNFSVDCLETLYDIGFELAAAFPNVEMRYIPCLNDSAAHIDLILSLISENI